MNDFFYKVNGIDYPVIITYKRMKNIHYRFIDGSFRVSCNHFATKKAIISGLDKFGATLIKKSIKPSPKGEDFIYILGVRILISEQGEINFSNGEKIIYKSKEDLDKKLRKLFLKFMQERVRHYSIMMSVPLYKVSIRNMTSRFGSNSKYTKSLHFATILMHYSIPIIDSVIIHELAHILVYNHSNQFYDVVYKYCPNYDAYRKKLLKGEFQ